MQYDYPAESSSRTVSRQCSSAPAVPTPQQDYTYWEPASASYASLYDPYNTFAPPPPPPPQSLEDPPSSPMSLYSPLSDAEYPYTPGMDVPSAPQSHSVYPVQTTSFDATEVWPQTQWPYLKHDVHGYSDASSYDDYPRESGICVFQDGSYQVLSDSHIPVSDYYYYHQYSSSESAASSPLSPLSDPSQWQACQHAETSFTTTTTSHSSASIPSDPIPLHQPRPTRRFNYQMMNDIAASLEASASSSH